MRVENNKRTCMKSESEIVTNELFTTHNRNGIEVHQHKRATGFPFVEILYFVVSLWMAVVKNFRIKT